LNLKLILNWQNIAINTCLTTFVALAVSSCSQHEDKDSEAHATTQAEANTPPTVAVVKVEKKRLHREWNLPGQFLAYQDVPIHAKVEGFISSIIVDRGSIVKKGQKMISIFCPELIEKEKEGAAKVASAESSFRRAQANEDSEKSKLIEAQARLDADSLTFQRLLIAAKTPGAVAQNEVDLQQKAVESDKARVQSIVQEVEAAHNIVIAEKHNLSAAKDVLKALNAMTDYLEITAPFDGVITERNVHVGSIVAVDAMRDALPLVRIQERDILRLVVAVPEDSVSGIKIGDRFEFTVPAFLGRTFSGVVARPAYALDNATRTMPVELNVYNTDRSLEPGMFATVHWEISRPYDTLFLPSPAVNTDLQGTFAIKVADGKAERVTVQRGLPMGNLIEISGPLKEGDLVAVKATDEIKNGARLIAKMADESDIAKASKSTSAGGE
jgi:membrane fusion protein, multidrug efflux system